MSDSLTLQGFKVACTVIPCECVYAAAICKQLDMAIQSTVECIQTKATVYISNGLPNLKGKSASVTKNIIQHHTVGTFTNSTPHTDGL